MIYIFSFCFAVLMTLFIAFPNESITAYKMVFHYLFDNPYFFIVFVVLLVLAIIVRFFSKFMEPY